MRLSLVTAAVFFAAVQLAAAGGAQATIRKPTHIPEEPLGIALQTLAKERGFQVAYVSSEVDPQRTRGASGNLTVDEALAQVLRGTGLTFRHVADNGVSILPAGARASGTPSVGQSPETPPKSAHTTEKKEGKTSSSGGFRLAQMDQGSTARARSVDYGSATQLGEVVVTAEKRTERLQDVPVPVSAISAETLVDRNQMRLEDYYTSIPGLSIAPGDTSGAPQLTIRGITTGGFTNPTVGVVIDDVPYGSSSYLNYGNEAPDIDPSELARVEVLRGPQGTLYGASSLGGLLKYVTIDPSTAGVSGRLQAGFDHVANGAELGYSARGAINVPLSDSIAIRVSGFVRRDPGFVDNVQTGERGVNRGQVEGGRVSALWKPAEFLSLKLSALVQDSRVDGSPEVDVQPGLRGLQQSDLRGTGWRSNDVQAYSLNVIAHLGALDLTSISGYSYNRDAYSYDYTPALGAFTLAEFGVPGTPLLDHTKTRKVTQEVRLSSSGSNVVDWVVGGFFNHESSLLTENVFAADPVTGAAVLDWGDFDDPSTFTEYAGFADVTFHVTHRFDIQIGGRESHDRQSLTETTAGPYDPLLLGVPSPVIYPKADTDENAFTYLLTPRLRLSPTVMLYARLASGFRPGGANPNATTAALAHFDPDRTENYEVGAKGAFLENRLTFDVSVYHIDWKDIQLQLRNPVTHYTYFANGSRAKSEGAELSLQTRPLTGLTVTGWVAWDTAELTRDLPPTSTAHGVAGDRLPYSSRFSASLSVEQRFLLTDDLSTFISGVESYVGSREGVFTSSPERQVYPAYAKTDLGVGISYRSWTGNLFVTNAFDRRGMLAGGLGSLNPAAFYLIQPRTVGLSVARTF